MGKYQRKKFFINKRLQLYYMFYTVIPLFIVVAFVASITLISQKRFISSTSAEIASSLEEIVANKANNRMNYKLLEEEKIRLLKVFNSSNAVKKEMLIDSLLEIVDEGTASARSLVELKQKIPAFKYGDLDFTKKILSSSYKFLFIGLLIVLLEIAFLTIFISHKVAGPVYRLMKWAEDMKNGKLATKIYLRQGDELRDVVDEFNAAGNFILGTVKTLQESLNTIDKLADKDNKEIKEAIASSKNILKDISLEEEKWG